MWALMRAVNMIWVLGRPVAAETILAELGTEHESGAEKAARLAVEACVDVVNSRCADAEEKAGRQ